MIKSAAVLDKRTMFLHQGTRDTTMTKPSLCAHKACFLIGELRSKPDQHIAGICVPECGDRDGEVGMDQEGQERPAGSSSRKRPGWPT